MSTKTTKPTRWLALETLEAREVPAGLTGLQTQLGDFSASKVAAAGFTPGGAVNAANTPGNNAVTSATPPAGFTTAPVSISQYGGTLYISGTGGNDNVRVSESNGSTTVDANGQTYSGYQNVTTVQFSGYNGNDRFVNDTGFVSYAFGDGGNDTLAGGSAYDYLWGGTQDDMLVGRGGGDTLSGYDGNDTLNGGAGADYMYGGWGNDSMVTIDGGTTDYADGEGDNDTAWLDQMLVWNGWLPTLTWDTCYVEKGQNVTGFANGADLSLDGDRIADPTAGGTYRAFDANPLFGSRGPVLNDAVQGGVGDCWLISSAGAIANDNPTAIRQNVVDFGDGTYGVKIAGNFYRVDNDLAVTSAGSTNLTYAKLGHEGSMWVAVLEKAFAAYRNGSNTYSSLANGSGHALLGNTGYTTTWSTSYTTAAAYATEIYNRWNNYECVTLAFQHNSTDRYLTGTDFVNGHVFTVVNVIRNSGGTVTGITLRNPWGIDNESDVARDGTNDGYMTVTPAQLFAWTTATVYGKV